MEREKLGELIYKTALLKGNFILRSGENSQFYLDKFRVEADPLLLKNIAVEMAKIIPIGTEVIAGAELGGIPLVTALSLETNLKSAFVRKGTKEYGSSKLIEGSDVKDRVVCIIEDIITTGDTTAETANKLRAAGAIVTSAICIVNRKPGSEARLHGEGLKLYSLFVLDEPNSTVL